MFILDFKNWLESCGPLSPPAQLTNNSLKGGIRSEIETGSQGDPRHLRNPFKKSIRRDRNYGKPITNNSI